MALPTISNADIVSRLKLLAGGKHFKADSGTTTTAKSAVLVDEPDITNYYISFISGDNIGIDRVVTSFLSQSGTINFDALDDAVDNTTEFCLLAKGFQSDIAQAGLHIRNDFRNSGYDLDLFLNADTQLKELYIYKTIELICGGLMNDADSEDAYFYNHERFRDLYTAEKALLTADYDSDEDGTISEDEENQTISYGIMER